MEGNRPHHIKASHLAKKAIVYVRQSSKKQVQEIIGSTEEQRGQARYLTDWGWPPVEIEIIEEYLGKSGMNTRRAGYQRLFAIVQRSEAGIIAISNISRGGREAIAWLLLFNECKEKDVLVSINGRVHNLRDRGDRVMLRILAVLAEDENEVRTETFYRARVTKAEMGLAVTPPPTSYLTVRNAVTGRSTGAWIIDPTPGVERSLRAVFDEFPKQRTLLKTVRALSAKGVLIPGRKNNGEITWSEPATWNLSRILYNPAYTGDYQYHQSKVDSSRERMECGADHRLKTELADRIIIPNHHPALVAREQFDEIQFLLALNVRRKGRGPKGPSDAILQSLLKCGVHGYRLTLHFGSLRRDGRRQHFYVCAGQHGRGGTRCLFLPGPLVDDAVRGAILARLEPARLEVLREPLKRFVSEHQNEKGRHEDEIRRRETDLLI